MCSHQPQPTADFSASAQLHRDACAAAALSVGRAVRSAVHSLPLQERARKAPSPLKPAPATSAQPDLVGEEAAFRVLAVLATQLRCEVRVIVDPASGLYWPIQPTTCDQGSAGGSLQDSTHAAPVDVCPHVTASEQHGHCAEGGSTQPPQRHMYCYLDAVDGTVKVSGLNSTTGRVRAANDGSW
jgi:hypothetical protein